MPGGAFMHRNSSIFVVLSLQLLLSACAADSLSGISGELEVRLLNPPVHAQALRLQLESEAGVIAEDLSPVTQPETRVVMKDIKSGLLELRVTTLSGGGVPLGRVVVDGVQVRVAQRTVVTIDLLQEAIPVDPPSCDDSLPAPICGECREEV